MTALCAAGGPSERKPGVDAAIYISSAGIGQLLQKYGVVWAVAWAVLLQFLEFELDSFCAVDPPEIPDFTAGDILALLNPDPFVKGAALLKIEQMVAHYAWWEFCHCVDSSEGAPTAAPPSPDGAPTGAPISVPVTPCATHSLVGGVFAAGTNRNVNVVGQHPSAPGGVTAPVALTAVRGRLLVRATRHAAGGAQANISFSIQFWNSATAPFSQITTATPVVIATTGSQSGIGLVQCPDSALAFTATAQGQTNSQTDTFDMYVDEYCGSDTPGGSVQPCCPPDTITQQLLLAIRQQVDLIQRQSVPFATIDGDAHSALSGQGTFSVQGLVGVRVDLTVTGSRVGREDANPDVLFNAGWIVILAGDHVLNKRRLDADFIDWLPRQMSDATVVAYQLTPGVTATITELEREP